jgi:hypothetical protein
MGVSAAYLDVVMVVILPITINHIVDLKFSTTSISVYIEKNRGRGLILELHLRLIQQREKIHFCIYIYDKSAPIRFLSVITSYPTYWAK